MLYGIDPLKSRLVRAGKSLYLEMADNQGEEQNGKENLHNVRLHYVAEVARRTGLSHAGRIPAIYRDRVHTIPRVGFNASRICR